MKRGKPNRAPKSISLDPDTAPEDRSVWNGLDREALERQAQALHRKKHVAGPRSYTRTSHPEHDTLHPLSFETERNLADDFAFIAACQPKVEYVTAAVIEQKDKDPAFLIKVAANEGISQEVREMFDKLFEVLRRHARKEITHTSCQEELFHFIVQLNCNKVLGRLGSKWFQPPEYFVGTREPLPTRLASLLHNNIPKSIPRKRGDYKLLDDQIAAFATVFNKLEEGSSDMIVSNVEEAIQQAFRLTEDGVKLPDRLRALGCPVACLDARDVREVGKVSNYWRIARHLMILSHRFRAHFANVDWLALPNYKPSTVSTVQSRQFIHAEIQLLVHYELTMPELMPRAIGVSKEACFFCDSFIRAHGRFSVSGAHRQIFPQWTIPDLKEFDPQTTHRFRRALSQVGADVKIEHVRSQKKKLWRPCPLQSAINLNIVHLGTPSTSTLRPQAKGDSEQNTCEKEADTSCSISAVSVASPEALAIENNDESSQLQEANLESRSSIDQEPFHENLTSALIEVPVEVIIDSAVPDHEDWIALFATFSKASLQGSSAQEFSHASVFVEPARVDETCHKIHVADIPEHGLVLEKDSSQAENGLCFALSVSAGKELHVRCQWHV